MKSPVKTLKHGHHFQEKSLSTPLKNTTTLQFLVQTSYLEVTSRELSRIVNILSSSLISLMSAST